MGVPRTSGGNQDSYAVERRRAIRASFAKRVGKRVSRCEVWWERRGEGVYGYGSCSGMDCVEMPTLRKPRRALWGN